MIKNFFTTAWRTLQKNRAVNALNILGLSAGMTSAVLIFLWVQNERSFDNYHPDADRIYRITAHITSANWTWASTPYRLAWRVNKEVPEVLYTTRMGYSSPILRVNDQLFNEKKGAYVDSNWFNVFHYDFIAGNARNFFSQTFSLILTRTKAKKYFGEKDPIGQTIRIDSNDYRVAGIIKDPPANSSFQYDVLMPVDAYLSNPENRKNDLQWGNFNYLTFIKLRPTANPAKVNAAINKIMHGDRPDDKDQMSLMPLKGIHFETDLTDKSDMQSGSQSTVNIFTILGIFLLVIACINYVNLTTARASLRAKEVGIRKIVGAGKKSLFTQFVFESLVISLVSLLFTILFVSLLMPFFRELTDRNFTAPFSSPAVWKILGLTLLAATVLNGIYPALLLSSFRPINVLKGAAILQFKDVYLRKGLVVLQFTFSIILIIGTIVIQRQLNYIQNTSPGYNRSQVFYFRLPWSVFMHRTDEEASASLRSIKAGLLAQSGITGVTNASQSIVWLTSANSGSADWDGHDTTFNPTVHQLSADADYQKVLQLQLQQGRWFFPGNDEERHSFILNETAVRDFNIHKPVLGQRFKFQGDTGKIIGVIKDFHFASLHERISDMVIFNHQGWRASFFVKVAPGQTSGAIAAARRIWTQYVHDEPFDYTFLDDEFNNLYKTDQKVSTLILLFSIIAIIISCLGLVGLAAFTAQQRIKEIGIRKVLGATIPNIIALLSGDFIRLVFLSVLISTPIAWWAMHKWLQDFAYHIPLSAWVFLVAGGLATLIALLTISTQSIRAATANPVKSLRTE
jgi:putative ABC transport system permease protein